MLIYAFARFVVDIEFFFNLQRNLRLQLQYEILQIYAKGSNLEKNLCILIFLNITLSFNITFFNLIYNIF